MGFRVIEKSDAPFPAALIVSIFPVDSVSSMRGSPYDVQI